MRRLNLIGRNRAARVSKRLVLLLLVAALALAGGCRRGGKMPVETIEEESQPLASMIHTADPRASTQLLRGFHDIEQGAWRWSMGKFSVTLKPPAGGAKNGARIEVKLSVPDPVIQKLQAVTLSASVNGVAIGSETFSKAGDFTFSKEIAASTGAMAQDAVTVDFTLDKFLAAGTVEQRELGVVVSSIGLLSK